MTFDFTKLLLPDACEFGTFEEFFVDDADEFHTCRSGDQAFAILADVATFEEGFDDGGTSRRTTNAVFLHGITKFFIVNKFSSRFHRTKQCGLCVRFGWLCPLLSKRGDMGSTLAFGEDRQGTVIVCQILFILCTFR